MTDEPLPKRIGTYEVRARLALGGMAEVLLAESPGAPGFSRTVVIKRVLPHFSEDRSFVEMFRDEAHITAQLHHGNIVQVLEFGEHEGRHFIVLEHVHGSSLATMLRELGARGQRLSIPEIAHVTVETARALDYAHHKRAADGSPLMIVHRDVSPSNILVSRDGEVKLTDFGIARARARVAPITQVGGVLKGKLPYMAPEALRGRAEVSSDIFALGVVLFEMLTGRSAFWAETEFATVHKILLGTVPVPSSLEPSVPPLLDHWVARLLAGDPAARPQRGLEVAEALAPLASSGDEPVTDLLAASLERLDAQAELAGSSASAAPEARLVLVVDQSRTLRALVRKRLLPAFEVVEASSAEQAQASLRARRPVAILAQSSLPATTGLDLCRWVRAEPALRDLPFLLMVAETSDAVERTAREAGAQRVVTKQSDVSRLREILVDLLES